MTLTITSGMPGLRARWDKELDSAQADLDIALKAQAAVSAEAVRIAHRIDTLRERIEQRRANLAKYR